MALATVSWDIECARSTQITLSRILSRLFCVGSRITTVTIVTRQIARSVNVVIEQLCRRTQFRIFKLLVTLNTGILLCGSCNAHKQNGED
jgi:hypothetical protein